jgi:hypothetical protein
MAFIGTPAEYAEIFKGVLFDPKGRKAVTPNGIRMGRTHFNATYGGHMWALDRWHARTTYKAWIAFTTCEFFSPPIYRKGT